MALGAGGLLKQVPQAVFETELSHTIISIIAGFCRGLLTGNYRLTLAKADLLP